MIRATYQAGPICHFSETITPRPRRVSINGSPVGVSVVAPQHNVGWSCRRPASKVEFHL